MEVAASARMTCPTKRLRESTVATADLAFAKADAAAVSDVDGVVMERVVQLAEAPIHPR